MSNGAGIAAGSAGIEAAFRDLSSLWNWQGAQMTNSKSWDRWKNAQTRGYLYKQIGLKEAGLNPILAASGGLGLGSGGLPTSVAGGAGGTSRADIASAGLKGEQGATERSKQDINKKQLDYLDNQIEVGDAQIKAFNARSQRDVAEAGKLNVQQFAESLGLARLSREASYWSTEEGLQTIIRGLKNQSYPNTWSAAGVRGIGEGWNYLKENWWPDIQDEADYLEHVHPEGGRDEGRWYE